MTSQRAAQLQENSKILYECSITLIASPFEQHFNVIHVQHVNVVVLLVHGTTL